MAKGKKSFTAYCDWQETFKALPDEKAGKLIKHLFAYVNDESPETDDLLIKAVFANIKATLKRDLKKWERKCEQNRDNVRKRWNKKDTNVYERIRTVTKHTDSDSDSDSDKEVDNINRLHRQFVTEIKNGEHSHAIESWKMTLKIDGIHLQKLLTEFKGQLLTDNKLHDNTLELRKHFWNWLNIKNSKGLLDQYKKIRKGQL